MTRRMATFNLRNCKINYVKLMKLHNAVLNFKREVKVARLRRGGEREREREGEAVCRARVAAMVQKQEKGVVCEQNSSLFGLFMSTAT